MQRFLRSHLQQLLMLLAFSFIGPLSAQIPPGYYDDAEGLTGDQLRAALRDIIDDHDVAESSELWIHFESTDQTADGKVWDMYSDQPDGAPAYTYEFVTNQCGNYAQEGDCFNREHSFPQSWYDDAWPMSTDLFHVYPTDGYVNGIRSNLPFGPVGNPNFVSTNGSKRGSCSWFGCNTTVFEPIDEYKGDFARSYFYMLTRYYDQVSGWESEMLQGDDFVEWARAVLMQWAANDPVSQKEIDRNNAIYNIQNNRNPFIDITEFAENIWGETVSTEEIMVETIQMWYANGQLRVESDYQNILEVIVLNGLGQVLLQNNLTGNNIEIPEGWETGMYIGVLRTQNTAETLRFFVD